LLTFAQKKSALAIAIDRLFFKNLQMASNALFLLLLIAVFYFSPGIPTGQEVAAV